MIRLCFKQTKAKEYLGFTCSGHAGYAEYGQDIICAGVSALVITTVESIAALTCDDVEAAEDEESGEVRCTLSGPASKETTLLLDALLLGCQMIAEEYGDDFIAITYQEV